MNEDKFKLMRYRSLQEIKEIKICKTYQWIIQPKDLGVNMSNDGTFNHHINCIAETARGLTGWTLRTFQTRERSCVVTIWKALVLPRGEYWCQLWSPATKCDINMLEVLQRSFRSRIWGLQHMNYWECLKQLRLYSL